MNGQLVEKQLAFHITTNCTLNCALCATLTPDYKKHHIARHTPFKQIVQEIKGVFEIYDFIEDITFSGGEPMLHPDLEKIVDECMKYSDQFANLRIFTNGTILPSDLLLSQMKQYRGKLSIVIDHYGPDLSVKAEQIVQTLENEGLICRVNRYYGQDQYYGGWVNYGSPSEYRGYTQQQLEEVYQHCHLAQYRCPGVFNGKLTNCSWALFGTDRGYMPLPEDEKQLINLLDSSIPLDEKKAIAMEFGKHPLWACQYCNGFDPEHSERFPAGEQL